MTCGVWWHYGLGQSLRCDPLGLEEIVRAGVHRLETSSPPPPLTSPSAELHPPLRGWEVVHSRKVIFATIRARGFVYF